MLSNTSDTILSLHDHVIFRELDSYQLTVSELERIQSNTLADTEADDNVE